MNPLSEVIIHALGLKDALRILALVVMVIGIPCCLVFKQPPMQDTADDSSVATDDVEPPQPRSIYDTDSAWLAEMIRKETNPPGFLCFGMRKDLWTEPVFILFLIGQFTKGIGYVFPFVHLVSHIGPALGIAILFLEYARCSCNCPSWRCYYVVLTCNNESVFPLFGGKYYSSVYFRRFYWTVK